MQRKRLIGVGVIIITSLSLFLVTGSCHKRNGSYLLETAAVKKGSIINTITATGTLEADTTVLIGTQVSGVINKIFVDFNTVVHKHQLMAELDTTPLQTQVRQAEASLDDSKAKLNIIRQHLKDTRHYSIKNLWLRLIMIRSSIIIKIPC